MKHQFRILIFSIGCFLIAPSLTRAQEASATTTTATEAADRKFLNHLEQADGTKPAPAPVAVAQAVTAVEAPSPQTGQPKPRSEEQPKSTTVQMLSKESEAKPHLERHAVNDTPSPARKKPLSRTEASVEKTATVTKHTVREESPELSEVATGRDVSVTTVTRTTSVEVPEEDHRGNDNGFFHRLFHHHDRESE